MGAAVVVAVLGGCSEDGDPAPSTTTTTTATTTTENPGTTVAEDPELVARLLTPADLPSGFAATPDVDDTITTFCVGQDATAGLSANGRASVGFARTPAGASVIELAYRFDADGAERFVAQAEDALESCEEIPDASGLAFTYEPASPEVATSLGDADRSTARFGTSVGSGNLALQIAVVQVGDVGALVAVLGVDQRRAASDRLAADAFEAALAALHG